MAVAERQKLAVEIADRDRRREADGTARLAWIG
jgi:hypothetical protein